MHEVSASSATELKRKQIVEAARVVLARDGLGGCTARSIAEAGPLTKSAIHYYFRDVDEIVDEAVAAHLDAMLASLREVAGRTSDPEERLREVLRSYLATFTEKPHAAYLWFEYWVSAGRRDSTVAVSRMLSSVESLLDDLLTDVAPSTPARGIVSWLLGTVVQQQARPLTEAELAEEIDRLIGSLTRGPTRTTASSPKRSGADH